MKRLFRLGNLTANVLKGISIRGFKVEMVLPTARENRSQADFWN